MFVYRKLFGQSPQFWGVDTRTPVDAQMRQNAGMYYSKGQREAVHDWYIREIVQLIKEEPLSLDCYAFLSVLIPLYARLGISKRIHKYGQLWRTVLENSGGMRVLYIGFATESVKAAHAVGLNNIWKFDVPEFELVCVKTPQTTSGVAGYPHANMKETTNAILHDISQVGHFDTAVFGCGAYGGPLMNAMRKRYPGRNLVYLGSDCYKMFGILTERMRWDLKDTDPEFTAHMQGGNTSADFLNADVAVWAKEQAPDPTHPEPKYWRPRK
jgi:hypothetical protein